MHFDVITFVVFYEIQAVCRVQDSYAADVVLYFAYRLNSIIIGNSQQT